MIEAIQVVRDVVIILSAVIITYIVVIVGVAVLSLTRKAEGMRSFVVNMVTAVVNPIKGVYHAIGRGGNGKR